MMDHEAATENISGDPQAPSSPQSRFYCARSGEQVLTPVDSSLGWDAGTVSTARKSVCSIAGVESRFAVLLLDTGEVPSFPAVADGTVRGNIFCFFRAATAFRSVRPELEFPLEAVLAAGNDITVRFLEPTASTPHAAIATQLAKHRVVAAAARGAAARMEAAAVEVVESVAMQSTSRALLAQHVTAAIDGLQSSVEPFLTTFEASVEQYNAYLNGFDRAMTELDSTQLAAGLGAVVGAGGAEATTLRDVTDPRGLEEWRVKCASDLVRVSAKVDVMKQSYDAVQQLSVSLSDSVAALEPDVQLARAMLDKIRKMVRKCEILGVLIQRVSDSFSAALGGVVELIGFAAAYEELLVPTRLLQSTEMDAAGTECEDPEVAAALALPWKLEATDTEEDSARVLKAVEDTLVKVLQSSLQEVAAGYHDLFALRTKASDRTAICEDSSVASTNKVRDLARRIPTYRSVAETLRSHMEHLRVAAHRAEAYRWTLVELLRRRQAAQEVTDRINSARAELADLIRAEEVRRGQFAEQYGQYVKDLAPQLFDELPSVEITLSREVSLESPSARNVQYRDLLMPTVIDEDDPALQDSIKRLAAADPTSWGLGVPPSALADIAKGVHDGTSATVLCRSSTNADPKGSPSAATGTLD